MSASVTKCPQCGTSFKVTPAQLQAANGKVRCGSCLHIFKADENWISGPAAAPEPAATKQPAAPTQAAPQSTEQQKAGKFNFDQAAIDSGSAESVLKKSKLQQEAPETPKPAAPKVKPDLEEDDENLRFSDDSELEDEEVSDTRNLDPVESGDDEFSTDFINLDHLEDDGFQTTQFDTVSDDAVAGASDDSWIASLLEDDEGESEEERQARHMEALFAGETSQAFAEEDYASVKSEGRHGQDDYVVESESSALQDLGLPESSSSRQDRGKSKGSLQSRFEPPPLEMDWRINMQRDWKGLIGWTLMSLLMLVILVGQYALINFETLARDKNFRPHYARVCGVLGCDLPELFNPAAIRSTNLVVRSHPDIKNVLVVDAILRNTASYEQPFPDLELYFSDLNNIPVASRRFKVEEYLAGEMAGKTEMPPAKSVHISLEIVDPGAKAVNYRLHVSRRLPAEG